MTSPRTVSRVARTAWHKRRLIAAWLDALGEPTAPVVSPAEVARRAWQRDFYVPNLAVQDPRSADAPFLTTSTCAWSDFAHPEFGRVCRLLGHEPSLHRKLWEFVYIYHHLVRLGAVGPGRRGVGFGVGAEPLPAAFAALGADIVATDAPPEIGVALGWAESTQHAAGFDALPWAGITDLDTMRARVSFAVCDMTAIPADLNGFDFCWSACCFEHLGSLRAGLDFVVDTVERVLQPGGIAVHTSEFNLSSNDRTLSDGGTVIYRRRDLEELLEELSRRGHTVLQRFSVAPEACVVDGFVDTPPYGGSPHLKLALGEFTATSVGLIVRRGQ